MNDSFYPNVLFSIDITQYPIGDKEVFETTNGITNGVDLYLVIGKLKIKLTQDQMDKVRYFFENT